MTKHRMGTLRFLLFYVCAIVIAVPPLNLRAPLSESSSHTDSNLDLNLTQTAANDTLLNLFPSSPPTNISLSSITNFSANAGYPPDPFIVPTLVGDVVIFGYYNPSPSLHDLNAVVLLACEDAIQHLRQAFYTPMPPFISYRYRHAYLTMRPGPHMTWTRWAWALKVIGHFQANAGALSFEFEIAIAGLSGSLGTGQVRMWI